MRITLIAVGKLKERWWRDSAEEYLKRMRPYATLDVIEVSDRDVSADEAGALSVEGADIIKFLPENSRVVVLDSLGRQHSSVGFSEMLADHALQGRSHLAFIIGGAAGLDPTVVARADDTLSLGPMTLPHQMARVVLLEQLYRAFKIQRGEPYHR